MSPATEPLRCLLVEDSDDDARLILRELHQAGFEVTSERVDTPEAMREALTQKSWDTVLSDYQMPHFSGPAALELLHATGPDLPFIIVSGSIFENDAVTAMRAGAHDYLWKDNLARLGPTVRRELANAKSRRTLHQGELELRQSAQRRLAIIDTAMDGFWLVDPQDGRLLEVNRTYARMSGYSVEELLALRITDLEAVETSALTAEHMQKIMRLVEDRFESRHRRKDGSVFDLEISAQFRSAEGGALVCFLHDITSRQAAAEQLRASELRWKFAIDGAGDGLWDWNVPASTVFFSSRWKTMLGFADDEIGNGLDEWSKRVHPDDLAAVTAAVQAHLAGTTPAYVTEHHVRCKDGSWKWILARGLVIERDAAGQPLRMIGTHSDITERKQAEARTRQALVDEVETRRVLLSVIEDQKQGEEALHTSLQEKEALLKEVHHRVKNNLQVITSLLRLEASRSEDNAARRVLRDMQGRILSMALLHETLYRSGIFGWVDLASYLQQLAGQLFRANEAAPDRVALAFDLSPVEADIDQAIPCGLIVNELLANSLKHAFTEGQAGEVRLSLQQDAEGVVRIQVSDTGVGLPADFEARRGKSLGLQLVSDLARQLRGTLEVRPGPGAGFAVTFTRTAPYRTAEMFRPKAGAVKS